MKRLVKKFLKKIRRIFSIKEPVSYPTLDGNYLKNKTAFITGGGSGIGFAIARSFVRNGANVIIAGRNESKLIAAVEKLKKEKGNDQSVDLLVIDISDTTSIDNILSNFVKEYETPIDILVNNAGVGNGDDIGKTSIEDFEYLTRINLEGTYFVSQFFLNYMREKKIKGNILNIASSSSLRPANSPYIISKWGILGLTKGLAKKGIQDGIVVNGIAPGPTATAMLKKENSTDINAPYVPAGRYVLPEEVANLSTILVSDMGRMVIGDTLFVTGGCGTITFDDIEY